MYNKYYGFQEKPFEITPDPRFLYLSDFHKEALAHLIYAAKEGKGFTVITGEVGTGKTMVGQTLMSRLDKTIKTVYLFNPNLSPLDFLHYICESLGLRGNRRSKGQYIAQLLQYLMEAQARRERVVLIIDEAQSLTPALLEEIRMLTNLETRNSKLLPVFMLGQPELNDLLDRHEFRQLKQRISLRYHMQPLNREDIKKYIQKRLKVAGAPNLNLFTPKAIRKIFQYSKGTPRLINVICDNALLIGYSTEQRVIREKIVQEVIKSLEGPRRMKRRRLVKTLKIACLAIFCVAAAVAGWKYGLDQYLRQWIG